VENLVDKLLIAGEAAGNDRDANLVFIWPGPRSQLPSARHGCRHGSRLANKILYIQRFFATILRLALGP
jgi:hypothetical protein